MIFRRATIRSYVFSYYAFKEELLYRASGWQNVLVAGHEIPSPFYVHDVLCAATGSSPGPGIQTHDLWCPFCGWCTFVPVSVEILCCPCGTIQSGWICSRCLGNAGGMPVVGLTDTDALLDRLFIPE